MSTKILMRVRGVAVIQDEDGSVAFRNGMTIDADGSPHAYAPPPLRGLDDLSNAGHPGNWWGIVTDSRGNPIVQSSVDPAPGYYISTTTYQRRNFDVSNPARYLDSERIPFIVVPGPLRMAVAGIVLGCRAVVEYRGRRVEAVVGDLGPATHLGEASMACADALRIDADPRNGGVEDGVLYRVFPGETVTINGETFELEPLN